MARYSLDDLVNPGADSSGGGHNAAVVGVRFSVPGQFGNAFAFNGSTYLIAPFSPAFIEIVEQITVAIWIKKTVADLTGFGVLVGRRWDTGFADAWVLFYGQDGADTYSWFPPTTDDAATSVAGGASTGDLNKWVHLAGTYDGTEMRIYTNGVPAATTAPTGTFRPDTELTPLVIGGVTTETRGASESSSRARWMRQPSTIGR